MNETALNIVLFSRSEIDRPLPIADRRARHILEVLKRSVGDSFDAGIVNGPRGKATVVALTEHALHVAFISTEDAGPIDPITLIVGLPRPQTARDILRDATTLGVTALQFVVTEKSDANYAKSSLWADNEWERHVINGAEQAFSTQVPAVQHGITLAATLDTLPQSTVRRYALDNYEATAEFARKLGTDADDVVLAIGPERGWSTADRDLFRRHRFELVHLGRRVLRAETAVIAALTLLKSARGSL